MSKNNLIPFIVDRREEAKKLDTEVGRGMVEYLYQNQVHLLKKKDVPVFLARIEEVNASTMADMMIEQRELYRFGENGTIEYEEIEQNSYLWDLKRLGSTGGSGIPVTDKGTITDTMALEYPYTKVEEMLYSEVIDRDFLFLHKEMENPDMFYFRKGHTLEPYFIEDFRKNHPTLEVLEFGMIMNSQFSNIHYSPDGINSEFILNHSILEIKALRVRHFMMYKDHPELFIKKHYKQVQLGMFMTDTDKAYLVGGVETGVINGKPTVKTLEVVIERDEEFIFNIVNSLNKVLPKMDELYLRHNDLYNIIP